MADDMVTPTARSNEATSSAELDLQMSKETIIKEDGRYLIYYRLARNDAQETRKVDSLASPMPAQIESQEPNDSATRAPNHPSL